MRTRPFHPRLEALDERVVPSFAAPTIYPVGPGAYSLAAADVTGDGILDLVTTTASFVGGSTTYQNQVGVLVGNGDGSFQPAQLSPSPGRVLVAGDVDGDGKADLITASDNNLTVLISNGNGTFQPAQPVTVPPADDSAHSIASAVVGDLNADGLLDLIATGTTTDTYVSGPGPYGGYYSETAVSTSVTVLIGTGLGRFDQAATYSLGSSGAGPPSIYFYGPDVGDFNGDGNLDLLTSVYLTYGLGLANYDYSALSARLGTGDGTFQPARITDTSPGARFVQIAVGDFNRDGKTDVLIPGEAYSTATIAVGNADGFFTAMGPFDIGQYAYDTAATKVGDVNGDGKIDLIFVRKLYENTWADVLLGNGNGTFTKPVRYDLGSLDYRSPTLADFNGDGLADLAAVDPKVGVIVYMNTGSWSSPPPNLRITDASVPEGNSGTTSMTWTVTLTHAATEPVMVRYATVDGTATSGSDYQAVQATLIFAPGETQKTISVAVLGDLLAEPDETFTLTLSNPSGASIADGLGIGTIVNDDIALPRISITDVARVEGRAGKTLFTFTVTLSAPSAVPVTVRYATANGTAKAGEDYLSASGTLTFAPGETTKTITVTVKGDRTKEADETFYLDLFGNSGNSLFTKSRGIGTILNDD